MLDELYQRLVAADLDLRAIRALMGRAIDPKDETQAWMNDAVRLVDSTRNSVADTLATQMMKQADNVNKEHHQDKSQHQPQKVQAKSGEVAARL